MKVNATRVFGAALLSCLLVTAGCGTSVKRIDSEEVKDLSGAWNDTDKILDLMMYSLAELDMKHVKQVVNTYRTMNEDFRGYMDRNADTTFDKVSEGQ